MRHGRVERIHDKDKKKEQLQVTETTTRGIAWQWAVFGGARVWSRAPEKFPRHQLVCPGDPHFGGNVKTRMNNNETSNQDRIQ